MGGVIGVVLVVNIRDKTLLMSLLPMSRSADSGFVIGANEQSERLIRPDTIDLFRVVRTGRFGARLCTIALDTLRGNDPSWSVVRFVVLLSKSLDPIVERVYESCKNEGPIN